jgi:lysophospholipase L1-like esterase
MSRVLALALLLAGCTSVGPSAPPPVSWGNADFSSYVAMVTSVSMGIQSGGLLDQNQLESPPYQIAKQAGANGGTFTQPLVASPGIPNLLTITSLSPFTLGVLPGTPPSGPYVPRPADGYDNLAISGAVVANAIAQDAGFPYFDIVLQGHGTMLRQAIAQKPTFITIELGANDAVRPLLLGGDPAYVLSVPAFATLYRQLLDSLAVGAPQAKLALANIAMVTRIPYATTVPLDVPQSAGVVRLRDASGPLPDGSLILLPAQSLIQSGYGFPSPAPPLPDSLVITVAERAAIEGAVLGFNQVIANEAHARGAALVDEYGLFERLAAEGVNVNGVHYTFRYVTGGLFSLDGIHPSALGSALLANQYLKDIDKAYGSRIPPVDLGSVSAPYPVALP